MIVINQIGDLVDVTGTVQVNAGLVNGVSSLSIIPLTVENGVVTNLGDMEILGVFPDEETAVAEKDNFVRCLRSGVCAYFVYRNGG